MINGLRIVVVLPAYNAAKTLEITYNELPHEVIDDVILVDDASKDETRILSEQLGIRTIVHSQNTGYGGNQKSCYKAAVALNADIVVMVHPDYQYSPKLVLSLAGMIAYGEYDVALGSRILAQNPIARGMPAYKYIANRFLTFFQNIAFRQKLSEYHTGLRAFSCRVLKTLPLEENSNDFIFDNEMLAQIIFFNYRIGEVSCPTRYEPRSSSINLLRSIRYGIGVIIVTVKFLLQRSGVRSDRIFSR